MRFFQKLTDKYNRFMYGRHGADQLFFALFGVFLALELIGSLLRAPILRLLSLVAAGFAIFRCYSRNIYRRREENRKFLAAWGRVKSAFALLRDRFRDRKTCRYRRCKACRAVLRLPIKRGKHTAVCPRCGKRMQIHIWF